MRGSWAKISKNRLIFVAIAVLTFCTVSIGYGLLEFAKYEQQANDKISEYTEYTRDKVAQACAGGDKLENIKCVNEAFEAKREYEYNQSDLVAQRQSALWAYIMAAAAVFGIALSAVGVWLVKTTFDETRKANEIAENTAERHLRPYVFVTDAVLVGTENDGASINVSFKNFGATPAYGVTIQSGVAVARLPVECSPTLDNDVSCASVIAPSQQIETSAIVEGVDAFRAELRQNDCIILHTKITYEISPGITDSDEQTVIMDIENITNGQFRFPLEGDILNL